MFRFFIRQSATIAFVEALALLFAINWLDLTTGHQVSLVLFYTAPIVLAVWLCDNKSVFVIAGLAGVLWSWADLVLGHSYSSGTVKQARDLSHGLVPVQLDEAGLPAALHELAVSTTRLLPVKCTFESAGQAGAGQNGKATHLYRIAQEAINNATKHGKARKIDMRLSANSSAMSLSIADDGTGFSKTEKDRNGVGISIMRYRANVVGGEFEIEERPKGGTIVSCTVPAKA